MTLTASALDPDVEAALVVYNRLVPLKQALGVDSLTDAELQLFAMVAHHTGLDPFTKQIYAIKRAGKVSHQTGIDGYRSVAERQTGQYAGSDEATYEECTCDEAPKHPSVARVVVHRLLPNGHMVNQTGVARWHELYPGSGDVGLMWRKMPYNQLAKCAEANGLRKAFPRVLAGVYIEEEMQQAGETVEGQAVEVKVAATVADRLAERRARTEQAIEANRELDAEILGDGPVEAPSGLCLAPSPYEDNASCGLAAGHLEGGAKVHKAVGPDGDVQASWPAK